MVIQYLDRHDTIPVVFRTESLEYDLSSRIRRIVQNEERVLGVLSGDADRNIGADYVSMMRNLAADFSVREIDRGKDIPPDITALFVLGGKDFDHFDLFPIDQFIMKGGRAFFAVEGVLIDFQRGLAANKLEEAPLLEMLAGYGVRVKREQVLDRYSRMAALDKQLENEAAGESVIKEGI